MLRGGLNRVQVPRYPSVVPLGFLVRIEAEFGEEGEHDFKLVLVDYDGKDLAKAEGKFQIRREQRLVNMGINMPIKVESPGSISARLIIDRQAQADWGLELLPPTAPEGPGGLADGPPGGPPGGFEPPSGGFEPPRPFGN